MLIEPLNEYKAINMQSMPIIVAKIGFIFSSEDKSIPTIVASSKPIKIIERTIPNILKTFV